MIENKYQVKLMTNVTSDEGDVNCKSKKKIKEVKDFI